MEIVETPSGIVIDELNTTIRIPQEPGWLCCYYLVCILLQILVGQVQFKVEGMSQKYVQGIFYMYVYVFGYA